MLLSSKDTGGAGVLCSGSKRNVRVTSLRNIVMQMRYVTCSVDVRSLTMLRFVLVNAAITHICLMTVYQ